MVLLVNQCPANIKKDGANMLYQKVIVFFPVCDVFLNGF